MRPEKSKRVRVLYDLSNLGDTFDVPHGKAGIFRTVFEIAAALDRSAEVEFVPCALAGFRSRHKTEAYLAEGNGPTSQRLRGISLVGRFLWRTYRRLEGSHQAITITKALLRYLIRVVDERALRTEVIAGSTIYFSPMYPVPTWVRRRHIPAILTVYDLTPILVPAWHNAEMLEFFKSRLIPSIRSGDQVVCISEATKKDLLSIRPDLFAEDLTVIPLAAASDKFHPPRNAEEVKVAREYVGLSKGRRYLLSLNTIEPRKNLESVVRAFQEICLDSKFDDVDLVLAGAKGWLKDDLLGGLPEVMRKRVQLPGFVEDRYLPGLYAGADVFLYVSLYEGFGLPPLEAMACGAPIICSESSSLPEVVGRSAILVPPRSIEAITEALKQVLMDPTKRREMSLASLERARFFSWDKTAKEHIRLFDRILSRETGRSEQASQQFSI